LEGAQGNSIPRGQDVMRPDFIERRIATGLIVSADYCRSVSGWWRDEFIEAPEIRRIARWCLDHFAQYDCAPGRDVESIYMTSLRAGQIEKGEAGLIEEILRRISDEYERADVFNSGYLLDQTIDYVREREVRVHNEQVDELIDRGQTREAHELAGSFTPVSIGASRGLEVGSVAGYERIEQAFAEGARPVIQYPGAIGQMLNSHLVRGGFVAFLAPEKRGKTWLTLDMAFRALRQKANVAFFQAGDLTEGQMLRRIAIHVARRSDDERYCRPYWRPVGDCVFNQFDTCRRADRNCDHGVYDSSERDRFRDDPDSFQSLGELTKVAEQNPDYRPCDSSACRDRRPVVWLAQQKEKTPLGGPAAARAVRKFFERYRRRFRLATYASDTLTAAEVTSACAEWERQDDFVPDVIVVDYADLMTADVREFRHRQDAIWRGLRGISQKRHALVVTATQADADSYKTGLLRLSNFSEDKRKFAHVTAMWGMNQSPDGREKDLGILRINELVAREGAYSVLSQVTVLQDLRAGRPFLESFSHNTESPHDPEAS